MGLFDGKTLLITGVLMDTSIAFHVAKLAQEQGAKVILTSFGRTMKITQTIARRLPQTPPVVELDVSNQEHLDRLAERLREHTDSLAGVLHQTGNGFLQLFAIVVLFRLFMLLEPQQAANGENSD